MVGRSVFLLYDCLLSKIEVETYPATSSCGKKTWQVILNASDNKHFFPYSTSSPNARYVGTFQKLLHDVELCVVAQGLKSGLLSNWLNLGVEPILEGIFIELSMKQINFW